MKKILFLNMQKEIYVSIKDFSNYTISNYGNVYNIRTNKQLKPYIVSKRYLGIFLYKNGKRYCKRINRLVAEHFLSDPNKDIVDQFIMAIKDMVVNHKDLNKINNYFENLEWIKQIDNVHHYYKDYYTRKFNDNDQMEYEREKATGL